MLIIKKYSYNLFEIIFLSIIDTVNEIKAQRKFDELVILKFTQSTYGRPALNYI